MLLRLALLILCVINLCAAASAPLKICAFNVQMFGAKKAKDAKVMDTLGRIFSRFDLCLVQEIRDKSGTSVKALLKKINEYKAGYEVLLSDRLGRSNSKEHKSKISVSNHFIFPDPQYGDLFEREPFVVRFKALNSPVKDFFIAGIHTSPSMAPQEVAALVKVYNYALKKFKIEDGAIMGDFNAGCNYFPLAEWRKNNLRKDRRFFWLIGDDSDTTLGKAKCPYDRAVVAGGTLKKHSANAGPWYYDKELKITPQLAKRVSDHYPIAFELQ